MKSPAKKKKPKNPNERRGGRRPGTGGARPNSGPDPYNPTKEERGLVRMLVGMSMPQEDIAKCVNGGAGIDPKTLRKHFAVELASGKPQTEAMVMGSLMSNIRAGKEASIFFYLKTRLKWRENDTDTDGVDRLKELLTAKQLGPIRPGPIAVPDSPARETA